MIEIVETTIGVMFESLTDSATPVRSLFQSQDGFETNVAGFPGPIGCE